jgi:hypothetical protein
MSDLELQRLSFLVDVSQVTSGWPPRARAELAELLGSPVGVVALRRDGDDDGERAANARAFARWWFLDWESRGIASFPGSATVESAGAMPEVSPADGPARVPLPTGSSAGESLARLASLMERFGPDVALSIWVSGVA